MAEYIDIDAPIDVAVYQRNRRIQVTLRQILESNDAKYERADVRPVVRAQIIDMRYVEEDGEWKCSRCGWQYTLCVCGKDVTSKIHFCPNCGAEMEES